MDKNEDSIRRRAYEIWEQEGRPHGKELEHWLRAFKEFGSKAEQSKTAPRRKIQATKAEADLKETKPKASKKPAAKSAVASAAVAAGEETQGRPRRKGATTH